MSNSKVISVANYVVIHHEALRQRHYILNSPGHARRWAAFAPGKVTAYRARHGENFCLVIAGDPAIAADFYAIPWRQVSELFVMDNAYPAPKKDGTVSRRWQVHLEGPPHVFQFELAPTDRRQRPRFDARAWYGNHAILAASAPDCEPPLAELLTQDETFPEGRQIAATHYRRERSPILVHRAKLRFQALHGALYCEVCGFDFRRAYGCLGDGFIEAHHTVPLKVLTEYAETGIEDLAMVCPNCHRMLHRGERWLSVSELAKLVRAASQTG